MTKNRSNVSKSECFRLVTTTFKFDRWMIGKGTGWYGLASAMEFAGIKDGECIRVSADDQRTLFGKVMFGKHAVRINPKTCGFETICSQAFGQDFDVQYHYPSHYYVVNGTWNRRSNVIY